MSFIANIFLRNFSAIMSTRCYAPVRSNFTYFRTQKLQTISESRQSRQGAHLDITTNPLSFAEWRRGSGRGGAPQEPLASRDQKPLSPALSPRFAAGRGSQLPW